MRFKDKLCGINDGGEFEKSHYGITTTELQVNFHDLILTVIDGKNINKPIKVSPIFYVIRN